jgi:hypothetical protein
MKLGPVPVDVHHQAGMNAANTIDVDQRQLVDLDAFEGSSFKHRTPPKLTGVDE